LVFLRLRALRLALPCAPVRRRGPPDLPEHEPAAGVTERRIVPGVVQVIHKLEPSNFKRGVVSWPCRMGRI